MSQRQRNALKRQQKEKHHPRSSESEFLVGLRRCTCDPAAAAAANRQTVAAAAVRSRSVINRASLCSRARSELRAQSAVRNRCPATHYI